MLLVPLALLEQSAQLVLQAPLAQMAHQVPLVLQVPPVPPALQVPQVQLAQPALLVAKNFCASVSEELTRN